MCVCVCVYKQHINNQRWPDEATLLAKVSFQCKLDKSKQYWPKMNFQCRPDESKLYWPKMNFQCRPDESKQILAQK